MPIIAEGLLKLRKSTKTLVHAFRRPSEPDVHTGSVQTCWQGRLPFDMMVAVMPFLDVKEDVLSVMRTCRDLYSAGIPTLLSFEVRLSTCTATLSFCSFMFVDLPHRAYPLRRLSLLAPVCETNHAGNEQLDWLPLPLQVGERPKKGSHSFLARFMFKIIQHARRLESLSVLHLEHWLQANPQLHTAIAHHNSLRALSLLAAPGGRSEFLLNHIQAPLSILNLTFFNGDRGDDPNPYFDSLPDSIEELFLCKGNPNTQGKQYPRIHTLSMSNWRPLDAAVLVKMFPNVVQLTCRKPRAADAALAVNNDILVELHERNRLAPPQRPWNRLDVLRGDPTSLYALGISHHVRTLHVDGKWIRQLDYFYKVVNDIQPLYLSIVTSPGALSEASMAHLEVSETAPSRLIELHILFHSPFGRSVSISPGLFKFIRLFTSVTHISIGTTFSPAFTEAIGEWNVPSMDSKSEPAWVDLNARFIASGCPPSVQHIALQFLNLPSTHWTVRRVDDKEELQVERAPTENGFRGWHLNSTCILSYTDRSVDWFY